MSEFHLVEQDREARRYSSNRLSLDLAVIGLHVQFLKFFLHILCHQQIDKVQSGLGHWVGH